MRLDSFLDVSAGRSPDKAALVYGDRRLAYAEIDRACTQLAAALREAGVNRGDRVAIYLENSPEAVIAIFAVLRADAVFVMVNPSTKEAKLNLLLDDSRASAVITDARRLPAVGRVPGATPSVHTVFATGIERGGATPAGQRLIAFEDVVANTAVVEPLERRAIDVDLAAVIYTSGSTGVPKGVMLTHRNMTSASTSITTYLGNEPSDIVLNVLPLSFDYGLYQALMVFQFGGTLVLERSFTYMHAVLETIVREKVTGLPLVPTIAALLLQVELHKYDFSALRYITNTGAALPVTHITELRRQFPRATLYSMYGLTECKRVSYLPPDQLDRRPDSVGRGMPNEEVYLIDRDGNRLESGTGELVVRGSNVMQGYWERPEETSRSLMPGSIPGESVLRTGDLFRMDEEGFLYFVGRTDDIIKTRGEKVSPREVEDVLYRLDGIAEAVVTGTPDPVLGQAICATVVLKPASRLSEQEVLRHCAQHLEDFMVPHAIVFRAAMPKTPNGKIDRAALSTAPVGPQSIAVLN